MSLQHKKISRIGDEYSCAFCGKMWSIDDTDPPACEAVVAIVGKGVRTWHSMPRPNMQNLPRVADGNEMTREQMGEAFHADISELELKAAALYASNPECQDEYYDRIAEMHKRAFATANSNPGCSQRVATMPPAFAAPYGQDTTKTYCQDAMYVIGLETPQGWKGCAIYAKSGDRAMRYFVGAFGHRLTQLQCNALVLDKVLGGEYNGSLTIPHAELRTKVLSVKSKYNTATGVKYELLSPINFAKAVNPNE
ncbi:hypothetical protein JT351_gp50 [Providencia phage vB_PreS-PibeRecoleta]|uniref:Uncharacterized protein n=1 Tax=Providencia phage vB_PreS-PibeRecoleta TaxID=2761109 RepID=A0A7G5B0Y3_9CAUD|nr:hypothetical protein JT351_gp50 [Providencia phage vB_PreS-PibeRecoleta]QMV29956.1 hypothetical protein [Providencia phage vB_PreS-PibeRecoleta]